MAQSSSGGVLQLAGAGIGGFYAFQVVRQLRRRAVNPDMADPARHLMPWLQALTGVLVAVTVAVTIALLWWMGPIGIIFALVVAVLAVILGGIGALHLWAYAEGRRRASGYMICEMHYPDAPRQVKASMRRIYRASKSVKSGGAYEDGMFGDIELDRIVYSAAERAIVSSELSAAIRDLRPDAKNEDRAALEDANVQIREISDFMADVEKALQQSASTARELSERIAAPERQRESERAAEKLAAAREDRRVRARNRLDEAKLRGQTLEGVDANDVVDRVTSVAQGFDEASEPSTNKLASTGQPDAVLGKGQPPGASDDASSSAITREDVLRAAKSSAGRLARVSAVAARAGVRRLGKREGDR